MIVAENPVPADRQGAFNRYLSGDEVTGKLPALERGRFALV